MVLKNKRRWVENEEIIIRPWALTAVEELKEYQKFRKRKALGKISFSVRVFTVGRLFRKLALSSFLLRVSLRVCELASLCLILPSLVLNPPPGHTNAESLRIISFFTWNSAHIYLLRLLEVTTQTDANSVLCLPKCAEKRLFFTPSIFWALVLLFQSLLNSKWGDCCSDEHEYICITELAVSSSKAILYSFLISKGIALISFDDVSRLIF